MKSFSKWITLLAFGLWLSGCVSDTPPNATVQKAFEKKFGDVNAVKWTHNADYSYAHFDQNGQSVVAVFGNDGQYMETDAAKPLGEHK